MSASGLARRLLSRPRRAAALAGLLAAAALPAAAAAAEEESSGGIASLGFNLPGLVAQMVNFLILLVVLRLFLYRPLMRVLDQRKQRIAEGLNRAQVAAEQAAASEAESRRLVELARAEGREAAQRAQDAAERLRQELEQRARAEADRIVARAREEVQAERDRAIQQLHQQFADLTITAAERVIGQSLDRTAHQRLIDEVLVAGDLGGQPGRGN